MASARRWSSKDGFSVRLLHIKCGVVKAALVRIENAIRLKTISCLSESVGAGAQRCDDLVDSVVNHTSTTTAWSGWPPCKGDTLSVNLAMLAGGILVVIVMLQAQRSSDPLGFMGVWRLQAGVGRMGSPADWAVALITHLQ